MVRQNSSPLLLTYINIRKIIGILAMSLPIVIFLVEKVFFRTSLQPSISAFYYTQMRWFFVLTLCCIGFFLFFYQGYDNLDKWLSRIAGIAAFLVALFPTSPASLGVCASPLTIFFSASQPEPLVGSWICNLTSTIHLVSAFILFATVAFFSFFSFTQCEHHTKRITFKQCKHDSNEKKKRNCVYRACGVAIILAILVIGLSGLWQKYFSYTTYWGEFVALFFFGVAWAVKGELLWKDAVPANNSARFNALQSRQVDGYKSGMGVFVLLIALWLTVLLYSAGIPPFNLFVPENAGDAGAAATAMTPTLGFDQTAAQNILIGILFVLVVIIFYFILNNQLLSLFWPLVRRSFRVDLGDDESGEKGELWTLFSNQVNELGLRPGFSVNPKANTDISTPSTLTPESSYLKTLFDLLNWIFPRIGYSISLNKLNSKKLGAGLSMAITKNDRKEIIADKTFWASTYRISDEKKSDNKKKSGDEKDSNKESDLYVYRLLMIPAYFWFADVVDRLDGFMPDPLAWESMAYYHLGNSLWYSDIEKGINFYTNSINLNQKNWPAYAALGRIWAEKSQNQNSKEIAREYLLLANNYLRTAIDGIRKTKTLDQVYFGALYNQLVDLLYLLEKDRNKLEQLLLQGYMVKKESLSALLLIQNSLIQRKPNQEIGHDKLWSENVYKRYEEVLNSGDNKTLKADIVSLKGKICDGEISKIKHPIGRKEIERQELESHPLANWLIDFLQALEFVLQILNLQINLDSVLEDKNKYPEGVKSWLTDEALKQFINLPCFDAPINMNYPLQLSDKAGLHFTRSHYRVQYNAACFYSQLASMISTRTKDGKNEKDFYIDLALDHLEMSLGVGGFLVEFAKKDSALETIRGEERYKDIMKAEESSSHKTSKRKGGDRSVYRRADGKWVHKRHGAKRTSKAYATQAEAIDEARKILHKQGGGELIVHGEDGKIRQKDTIPPGNDPRNIKG